jgi:hypothetical protein
MIERGADPPEVAIIDAGVASCATALKAMLHD